MSRRRRLDPPPKRKRCTRCEARQFVGDLDGNGVCLACRAQQSLSLDEFAAYNDREQLAELGNDGGDG